MNDLEDLVREELRARVAAAEAAHPAEPATALLGGLDRRIRLARFRRRWAAAALSAVAITAAVALPLALGSAGPGLVNPAAIHARSSVPLTDPSLTPPGWAPVANRLAQISVPASWRVSPRLVCGRGAPGYVVVGTVSTSLTVRRSACRQAPNVAAIVPVPAAWASGMQPTGVINGIGARRVRSAAGYVSYLVPSLNVQVTARGPLASRVLATLTRSPRAVALARGRSFPVPRAWQWHDFGGIRFAAPARWQLERDDQWGGCGFGIQGSTVRLSSATKFVALRCPALIPTARVPGPKQGIVIGTGRFARRDLEYVHPATQATRCLRLHGMLACALAPDIIGNAILTLAVHTPGRRASVTVEIGLAGTGATARTILDSIRPG